MEIPNSIVVEKHPLLLARVFVSTFPTPLGQFPSPVQLIDQFLKLDCDSPCNRSDGIRTGIRAMLRNPGFKPSGRNKPASEYLVQAAEKQTLGTINPAVDICNIVSLNSGFPISVIDLARATGPFSISICPSDSEYVFNPAGQILKLDGLICLHDADGPCANGVKDAQRTKTDDFTTSTLSVIWGSNEFCREVDAAQQWYVQLLNSLCVKTVEIETAY